MNVLLDPDMTLNVFLSRYAKYCTDGADTWVHVEGFLRMDKENGYYVKVDPLSVPDEVVEALKLDSVL
jgi:hypothetical protein